METKSVVVTGASTGIGLGIATVLTEQGFHVFGTVRRQVDADRLQGKFGPLFTPLLMDVTDESAIQHAAEQTRAAIGTRNLAGLVNNAGVAVGGPLLHLTAEELRRQLEINLIGPFSVTKAFVPLLGAESGRIGAPGRIVQISSVAGKFSPPFLGPYTASKHALEAMSGSLRRELMLYGIDVIVVGPGAVVTPIWDKAEAEGLERFNATDYAPALKRFSEYFIAEGRKGLSAQAIGKCVHSALTTHNPKARYAVVPQKSKNWTLPRLLPDRVMDRLMGNQLGLIKGANAKR